MSRLVLTRKLNEAIVLHQDGVVKAIVKVSKIDRNQIRLTFEANQDIRIDRQELYQKNDNDSGKA